MSFQPVIVGTGMAAWGFLKRTMAAQTIAFETAPEIRRDADYFAAHIGKVDTAEDLVKDRRLLSVALGAFGLDDDLNNRFFIQRILEEGTLKPDALANRLADSRYKKLSASFGFGDFDTPSTKLSDFADRIIKDYHARQFEVAVGEQDDALRQALNATRTLGDLAQGAGSPDTKWFTVMGDPPLRSVFETALGLPKSFAQLELDQQLAVFREKLEAVTGDSEVTQFARSDAREKLVQRFLLMDQISQSSSFSPGQIALTLLQS